MTDTKHELPKIDWSKPVEAFVDNEWREVTHSLRNNDGSLHVDEDGEIEVYGPGISEWLKPHKIRNKPKPLEVWANVYPASEPMVYSTEEDANNAAGSSRIRCALMREVLDHD